MTYSETLEIQSGIETIGNLGTVDPLDRRLICMFEVIINNVDFSDYIVPHGNMEVGDIDLSKFGLVPLIGRGTLRTGGSSAVPSGRDYDLPRRVTGLYSDGTEDSHKPYLDTGIALGLTYREDRLFSRSSGLRAIMGICGNEFDQFEIRQLQAVDNVSGPQVPGLNNGFKWRDSLVSLGDHVAAEAGAGEIVIQSAENNEYLKKLSPGSDDYIKRKTSLKIGYDRVAKRMGYTKDSRTGNWVKSL